MPPQNYNLCVPLGETTAFAAAATAQANSDCAAKIAALDPGSTVAIIGAGLSAPEFPLWPQLAREVCKACSYRKGPATAHPKTFQAARDHNPKKYASFLTQRFSAPILQVRLSLLYLFRLRFRAYITTNFDNSIVSAAECVRNDSVGVYVYPEHPDPPDLNEHNIVFIHGRCADLFEKDPDNLVLHYDGYKRAYVDLPGPLFRFFRGVFASYNCLFVGTSLTDPPLQYLLGNLAQQNGRADATRMLLLSSNAFAANTVEQFKVSQTLEIAEAAEWKSKQSIDVLRYAPLTTNHGGLEFVFRTVCETRRSLSPSERLAMPTLPLSALEL